MGEQKHPQATKHTSDPCRDRGTHWDSVSPVLFILFFLLPIPEQIRNNSVSWPSTSSLYPRGLDGFFLTNIYIVSLSLWLCHISQVIYYLTHLPICKMGIVTPWPHRIAVRIKWGQLWKTINIQQTLGTQ